MALNFVMFHIIRNGHRKEIEKKYVEIFFLRKIIDGKSKFDLKKIPTE